MPSTYPFPKLYFQVECGGTRIGFCEVTGLDIQVEAIEYREGFSPTFSKIKMPGLTKYSNIALKRARSSTAARSSGSGCAPSTRILLNAATSPSPSSQRGPRAGALLESSQRLRQSDLVKG